MYISICVRLLIFCSNSKEGVKAITSPLRGSGFSLHLSPGICICEVLQAFFCASNSVDVQ